MKYAIILLIVIFLSSCGTSKPTVIYFEDSSKVRANLMGRYCIWTRGSDTIRIDSLLQGKDAFYEVDSSGIIYQVKTEGDTILIRQPVIKK